MLTTTPQNPKYDFLVTDSGRRKKIKKPVPPGLSPWDEHVLRTVRRKAWRYEWWVDCHCCCGLHLQFGTATLWGLLPVVGDAVSLLNALALVRAARRIEGGLPAPALVAMLAWAAVDFVIKLVPVLGEIVTAVVKPNTRNAMRVERILARRGEARLAGARRTPARGGGADEPLLVRVQPSGQRTMDVSDGAGPSYSAVGGGAATGGEEPGPEPGRGKGASRSLLPFWRRNEDSDSEGEESGRH